MLKKILCPGKKHRTYKYEKILIGYDELPDRPPRVFYVHCDDIGCKFWHKITFNEDGTFFVEVLPKKDKSRRNVYLNFAKIPVAEKC